MNTRRGGPPNLGPLRQADVFAAGLTGALPPVPSDPRALEERAREVMTPEAFAYMAGGAGAESTVAENRAAFERWRIVPRMLRDVSRRTLATRLFGADLSSPLLLAPIGVLEMAHPDADLAVARAAAGEDVPMIFSSQASVPMEVCAAAMGDAPRWFQLYWSQAEDQVRSFVQRAEACGCGAVVLTLDTTMLGWRPRDLDLAYSPFLRGRGIAQYTSDPAFSAVLSAAHVDSPAAPQPGGADQEAAIISAAAQRFSATYPRPSLSWDDLRRLREFTRLPILLKGILHPEDARLAVTEGIDGIIVSNHGGRQVDGAIAALDALPKVVDAVDSRIPILFDSGIRGGADVFKALALGAAAVCLGRPIAYGLAVAGEDGVRAVIRNVLAEFDLTLALSGCASVREITRDRLVRRIAR